MSWLTWFLCIQLSGLLCNQKFKLISSCGRLTADSLKKASFVAVPRRIIGSFCKIHVSKPSPIPPTNNDRYSAAASFIRHSPVPSIKVLTPP